MAHCAPWAPRMCGGGRAVLDGGGGGFVMATDTNLRRDALCFMANTWTKHKTTNALLNNGWRSAVGGGWWWVVPRSPSVPKG